ncbi:MAG: hypothetical protein HY286_14535 [Planctomycetes bacterium]|nr:hypothetical protein [Planctomycetota bacterium]
MRNSLLCGAALFAAAAVPARADVLHGKDGKPVNGKFTKETAANIEWIGEDGKKKEFPKSKVARVDFTWTDKAPLPAPPLGDVKELKNLLYADATLGIAFEPPKDFFATTDSMRRKLILKSGAKGMIQFKSYFTISKPEAIAKRIEKDDGSSMPSVEWKEEEDVAAPFPGKRMTATWKPDKTTVMKREYQILQLPGRVLAASVESPAGGFAAAQKSAAASFATLREFEPDVEQKFDKGGFAFAEMPRVKLQFKGSSSHKMQSGGLEGDKYEWFSEAYALEVYVYDKDIPADSRALKDLVAKEYTKYSNVSVKGEGTYDLLGLECQWVDVEADLKDNKKQQMKICMLLAGGKLYSINLYPRSGGGDESQRVFENCVGVFRAAGMRPPKDSK